MLLDGSTHTETQAALVFQYSLSSRMLLDEPLAQVQKLPLLRFQYSLSSRMLLDEAAEVVCRGDQLFQYSLSSRMLLDIIELVEAQGAVMFQYSLSSRMLLDGGIMTMEHSETLVSVLAIESNAPDPGFSCQLLVLFQYSLSSRCS